MVLRQEKSAKAVQAAKSNKYPHRTGSGGYDNLWKKIEKKIAKFGRLIVVNGRTKEEVDLSEMSRRAIQFLVARCTEDEEGRFVVEDVVVEVLDEAVHKFTNPKPLRYICIIIMI